MMDRNSFYEIGGDPLRLVGRVLGGGRYRIDSYIGGGGQARVYRGTHMGLSMPVAIKILPADFAQDGVLRGRFEREARELARLRHAHIVGIYDYAVEQGLCYIVSEFIAGTDLKSVIGQAQGPLPMAKVCAWVEEIGSALQCAHDRHIVHRDVKPGNILIDGTNEHAVLCDFGLARSTRDDVQVSLTIGGIVGTPAYMSPEQCLLLPVDQRTDIYSFALVTYEMLTGKNPIAGKNETSEMVRYKQVHHVPPPPSSLNPALSARVDRTILKALSKDPKARQQTASEFVAALVPALRSRRASSSWPIAAVAGAALVIAFALSWPSLAGFGAAISKRGAAPPTEVARTATVLASPQAALVATATAGPTQQARATATATPAPPTATGAPTGTPRPTTSPTAVSTTPPTATSMPTTAPTERPTATTALTSTPTKPTATATVRASRTATTPPTTTPRITVTATTKANLVQVTIQIEGLDDAGLRCSSISLRRGDGDGQELQRVALASAPNPRSVSLAAAGATWVRFEGGPDGNCPWSWWTPAVSYDRVPITGSNAVLTWRFAPKKSDGKGNGCGGPGEPPCP